jgi:hypothetical protein
MPHTRTVILHAWRRVAAFPGITSKNRPITPALMTWAAKHNGIIRLTFTA